MTRELGGGEGRTAKGAGAHECGGRLLWDPGVRWGQGQGSCRDPLARRDPAWGQWSGRGVRGAPRPVSAAGLR